VADHLDRVRDAWLAVRSGADEPGEMPDLHVTGAPGHLPSHFAAEEVAIACVGAALLAAGQLAGLGEVALDRAHVADAVRSERFFSRSGQSAGVGFAPLSRFWRAADGWVRTHANYPWHRAALVSTLGAEGPDGLADAIAARPAVEVEEAVFGAGGIAAAVRSRAEWESHPQGGAVGDEDLISHSPGAPAAPSSARSNDGPASGVRVLDLTRVIAGPVCTRYLGALGADVLRLDPPGRPDMRPGEPSDTLMGKRSAPMDLAAEQAETVRALLAGADVVVTGYRPGALDRFGLGADALAEEWPGLVIVQLAAWGHTGPWAERRGFDSVVQGPTGIAMGESADGEAPGALPCQLLDHGTGYLAAAAALDGLHRQRTEGGTHVRRLSLARTAGWIASTWTADATPGSGEPAERPWVRSHPSPDGPIEVVDPPGSVGGRALRWPGPPSRYLADRPAWR
jgi:hypothetical protein